MKEKFRWMTLSNTWLWFHILSGDLLGRLCDTYEASMMEKIVIVLMIAVGWEIYELLISDVKRIYGSIERFFYDASGDIFGALLAAMI